METTRKAPRLIYEEALDATVWGKLQEHIPLHTIYEKLSQQDLFQLRIVSKEWNHAALQWTLPKPSFVTIAAGVDSYDGVVQFVNGIVTYNSVSGEFNFTRQHLRLLDWKSYVPPFQVEGLILCHNPDDLKEWGVYNVHNRTWHVIPAGPIPEQRKATLSTCGLLVDTTVKPYTFKLIEGNINFNTQIYDSKSRSWSTTSSRLPSPYRKYRYRNLEYSCICNNGDVYISEGPQRIRKYSLKDDQWTVLKGPNVLVRVDHACADNVLGVWAGRIFTTREHHMRAGVTVWELVDSEGNEWVEYACMPNDLYLWLWKHGFHRWSIDGTIARSFFQDGYLLVCSWQYDCPCANRFALFNIATKAWQKVDLPKRAVAFDEDEPYENPDDEDDESDEDVRSDEDDRSDDDDKSDEDDDVDE